MKLTRQSAAVQKVQPIGDYPHDIPQIDTETLRRVPGLEQWYSSLQKWWFEFRTVLRRREQEVLDPVNGLKNFETSTNAEIASLKAQIASLIAELAELTGNVSGIDLSALQAAITALQVFVNSLDVRVTALESRVTDIETEVAAIPNRERFEFEQVSPVSELEVEHGLNRTVGYTMFDIADRIQRFAFFQVIDENRVLFRFNGTKTFRAVLQ